MKMRKSKLIVVIMLITVGYLSAMEGAQKTENYGYYEKDTKVSAAVQPSKKNKAVDVNESSAPFDKNVVKESVIKEETNTDNVPVKKAAVAIDHSAFDALLRAHVSSSGKVDYAAIKSKISVLDKYLGYLSQNVPSSNASKNEKLAFWINAYNANTIKLIVDNYPVNSIMDLYGGKAFDNKWIKIGGETLSLNDIENNKIRAKFNEPRIHFAVNCAAKSCPPILNKAWTADNLEANLNARTKAFVNDSAYNKLSAGSVEISKIFEWYAKDFPGDIVSYLNKYSSTSISKSASVSYIEYDWALNKK